MHLTLFKRSLRFLFRLGLLFVLMVSAVLVGCQSKLIYFPRPYAPDQLAMAKELGLQQLSYQTEQGQQSAWYGSLGSKLPAKTLPDRIILVCAGNGSLSLDHVDNLPVKGAPGTSLAYLFFDYPSYGGNEGRPSPERIRQSAQGLWAALQQHLGAT
jgi:uncharacterized protein